MSFPPPSPRQARILWFTLTALAVVVCLMLAGAGAWCLGWLMDRLSMVLVPVVLALVLAYLLDPVVEFLIRKKLPRTCAIALVFLFGLLALGGILGSVLPGAIHESRNLVEDLPQNVETLRSKAQNFLENSRVGHMLPPAWRKTATDVLVTNITTAVTGVPVTNLPAASTNQVTTNRPAAELKPAPGVPAKPEEEPANDLTLGLLKRVAQWTLAQLGRVRSWVESTIGFILLPICLFYFLQEKQRIKDTWQDYLPLRESKTKEETVFILSAINDSMIIFFRGQVLVALCVGLLLTIGYLLLGLKYAVLLGIVAFVLGIVPYLGTIVTLILALTHAIVQFGDWQHPLMVVGIAALVKLLEDFVIYPKVIGGRANLHPLATIVAVLVGISLLGGFMGAVLAVPATLVLRTLMFRYVWKNRTPASKAGKGERH
jgi:predicted PurR-regulated permease PerM